MTPLTLQDLRICADLLHAEIESDGDAVTQWYNADLVPVLDKITTILSSIQIVETLPGQVAAVKFKDN